MSRRRMMYKRPLIEVYEELKTVGSGTWIVPRGCVEVDVFVVAGGKNGGSVKQVSGGYSGAGGNGGECITVFNMAVIEKQSILYKIGAAAENSVFGSITAISGNGAKGGEGVLSTNPGKGKSGLDGVPSFLENSNMYGAGGGSGGAHYTNNGRIYAGGVGGKNGGGNGGRAIGTPSGTGGENGNSATFYGGGGGGAGLFYGSSLPPLSGGSGYQGIIILRYKKYK